MWVICGESGCRRQSMPAAVRIGASGLRNSWPRLARNSSLRCSASRRPYWRLRARNAAPAALMRASVRTGRSSTVTLPSMWIGLLSAGELAPTDVNNRIGRSDQFGWSNMRRDKRSTKSGVSVSSTSSSAPSPSFMLWRTSSSLAQIKHSIPAACKTFRVSSASLPVCANTRMRSSRLASITVASRRRAGKLRHAGQNAVKLPQYIPHFNAFACESEASQRALMIAAALFEHGNGLLNFAGRLEVAQHDDVVREIAGVERSAAGVSEHALLNADQQGQHAALSEESKQL